MSSFETLRRRVHNYRQRKAAAYLEQCKAVLESYDGPGGEGRYETKEEASAARKAYMRAYATVYSRTETGRANTRKQDKGRLRPQLMDRRDTREFYRAMLEAVEAECFYCKRKLKKYERTGDHYVPLSRGGAHSAENLRIACLACNISKGNKMPEEWAELVRSTKNFRLDALEGRKA